MIINSAYDFTYIGYEATNFPLPTVIDGETYSVIIGSGRMCKATSVKPLIEKTVTVTVTTSPDLVTTVVAWDYETDLILASAAALQNYIYVGGGTTSTCIGAYNAGCDGRSNPLSVSTPTPTPTRAPESSYVAPPSHPVTQFTPAPSCLAESNLWFVSTDCYLTVSPNDNRPPWLSCTMTEFGEPDLMKTACYGEPWASTTVGRDGTESFYATCPVGYTTASVSTTNPFDKPLYATAPTERFDVVVSSVRCCPSGHDFKFTEIRETSTSHNGRQYNVQMLPMPACVATHVKTLSGEKVTMKLYSDSQVWDKRQEETPLTTTAWDYEHDTLWARHMNVYYTVFHGTYTCYEKCDDYFTYSYHNTDPNAPTTTSDTAASETTSAGSDGGGGDRDKSGANAVRGDGLWMLAGAAIALWIVQ